jgi:hypothetical protein
MGPIGYLQASDQENKNLIIATDVESDETLLGFVNFRNKAQPLYISDANSY